MKNLKRALSLVLSTAMLVGMMVVGTGAAELKDIKGHDHQQAAELMAMIGVMEGDGENFNPDKAVTRNEMAVVICNLMDLKLNGYHPFTDVPEWADKYVGALYINELTSGTSATTYGGAAEVTTTEAALMIMKTLGYFEYQGEFEEDWALATVKRATLLNLFEGIEAGVKETLTRGEVAQMVMNALDESIVVAKEVGGMNVTGDGFTVSEKASYSYPGVVVGYTNQGAAIYETLMSKLFDNTLTGPVNGVANDTDAFGRPAFKWTYTGEGKNESVTVTKKPAVVFTAKTSEDDVNKALKEYTLANVTMCTNGKAQNAQTTVANKGELGNNSAVQNDTCYTANGKTVEIYADKNLNVTHIVAVDEYVGKVSLVNKADEAKAIKRSVVVDGLTFETEDFARKDMVIYTKADNVIKSMKTAEFVLGKVTATAADYIKIDGVSYKFNAGFVGNAPATDDEVKIYLDSNGYLLEMGDHTKAAAAISEYALITSVGAVDEFGTINVKVLYADGTTDVLKLHADHITGTGAQARATINAGLYTFEKTDDGYKFTAPETQDGNDADTKVAGYDIAATSGSYVKDKGTLNGWAIADDAVFFVNKNNGKFAIATGAELKKADSITINAVYANKASTGFNVVEFGYVTSALSGTSDLLFGYVVSDTETIKNADKVMVDYITLWNGSEIVSYEVSASGDTGLDKKDFVQFKLNADGEIDANNITEMYAAGAIEALDIANEKIVINSTEYKLTEDSIVIFVDTKNVAGYVEGDLEIAEKVINNDGTEGNYINNVCYTYKTNSDNSVEITGLFFDINNLITVPVAPQ